ncbi:MAG: family 10 glycosylhydrolase [Eubacteriales bacterium]|nr:family 10 glycosylhydrolase [Eubacteriales bacterium]
MKKAVIFMLVGLLLCSCGKGGSESTESGKSDTESNDDSTEESGYEVSQNKNERDIIIIEDMKAIWVSQYDMAGVYCSGGVQRSRDGYTALVRTIIANIVKCGFNTVIYQIRPFGDSMYESDYYPASRFVTGEYGRDFGYDAVEIFVDTAHEAGLSVQAWINPMRLMTVDEIDSVPDGNIIKKWYAQGLLPEVNGRLYLDVSRKEARELIVSGAAEALDKYPFDGLHMDDYFYPTSDTSFDTATFTASGYTDLTKFREDSLNALVSSLYSAVKGIDERLIFGIAPSGNLKTIVGKYYADVYEWCGKAGYIDYIMPQVYFGLLHGSCPFVQTVKDWAGIIKNGKTKLYVGMTLGKAVSGSQGNIDTYAITEEGKNEWINHKDVLKECVKFLDGYENASGYCFFCYQYFYDPVTGEANAYSLTEVEAFLPVMNEGEGT